MGALTCGIVAIEIIINTVLENKGKKTPKSLIISYLIISILLGITTYSSFVDGLPILESVFFVFTLRQSLDMM